MTEEGPDESEVVIPKKKLGPRSRVLDHGAQKQPRIPAFSDKLPLRTGHEDDRPSYSREYLDELRNSTPATPPRMVSHPASEDEREKALVGDDFKTVCDP
jgi:hypothetical protein